MSPAVAIVLGADETVARFIYSTNHYAASKRRVKPTAFDPTPHPELSVAHSTGLSDPEIWRLARQTLTLDTVRTAVYARADIRVAEFLAIKLKTIRDDHPFERHANVSGWPEIADQNERKRTWKGLALRLADKSELQVSPQPILKN